MADHVIQKKVRHTNEQFGHLVADGVRRIFDSKENYLNFLEFVSNNYDLPYFNIIACYEAFPQGITFNTYNGFKSQNRQVCYGEKSIAVIDYDEYGNIRRGYNNKLLYTNLFGITQTKLISENDKILTERLWRIDNNAVYNGVNVGTYELEALRRITDQIYQKQFVNEKISKPFVICSAQYIIDLRRDGRYIDRHKLYENNAIVFDIVKELPIELQRPALDVIIKVTQLTIRELEQKYAKTKGEISNEGISGHGIDNLRESSGGSREYGELQYSGGTGEHREIRRNAEHLAERAENETGRGTPDTHRTSEQGTGNVQLYSNSGNPAGLSGNIEERQTERTEGLSGQSSLDERAQSDGRGNNSEGNGVREIENEPGSPVQETIAVAELVEETETAQEIKLKNIHITTDNSGYKQLSLFDFADEGDDKRGLQAAVVSADPFDYAKYEPYYIRGMKFMGENIREDIRYPDIHPFDYDKFISSTPKDKAEVLIHLVSLTWGYREEAKQVENAFRYDMQHKIYEGCLGENIADDEKKEILRYVFGTALGCPERTDIGFWIKRSFLIENTFVKENFTDELKELDKHYSVNFELTDANIEYALLHTTAKTHAAICEAFLHTPEYSVNEKIRLLENAFKLDNLRYRSNYFNDGYYGNGIIGLNSNKRGVPIGVKIEKQLFIEKNTPFFNDYMIKEIDWTELVRRYDSLALSGKLVREQDRVFDDTEETTLNNEDKFFAKLHIDKKIEVTQQNNMDSVYVVCGVGMQMYGGGEHIHFISKGENAEVETRIQELPKLATGFNKETFDEEFYFDKLTDAEKFAELVRINYNNDDFAKAWSTALKSSINFGDTKKLFDVIERFVPIEQETVIDVTEETQQPTAEKQKQQERRNYKIAAEQIRFSEKERYGYNIEAIKLLKQLEQENRLATMEEQDVLSRYVGWGGLSGVFDDRNERWNKEYKELKELLTEKEYSAARQSTATAFYTPGIVTSAIYDALENFGFDKGNILEPAVGIGNFFGAIPDKMSDSRLYGVEMDDISGRIAKQLYQKANIKIEPYQQAEYPDNFFDVAISNVPFAQIKPYDPKYNQHNFVVHDYYFAKTLDKVRPGGVIAFVTSTGTMDKTTPEIRKYIAQRADLLGAIRLPNTTFKSIANTSASADIIFLQKREYIDITQEPDWVYLEPMTVNGEEFKVNSYFVQHPEMILGTLEKSGMYGGEQTICAAIPGMDLEQQLNTAIQNIKGEIIRNAEAEFEAQENPNELDESTAIPAEADVRDNSLTIFDGKLYERKGSMMYLKNYDKPYDRARGYMYATLSGSLLRLIDYEASDAPDIQIEQARKKLNIDYQAFVDRYGIINDKKNQREFYADTNYSLLSALEVVNDEGKLIRNAEILDHRTITPYIVPSRAASSYEALSISLSQKGQVDIDYICKLVDKEENIVLSELDGIIYRDFQKNISTGRRVYVTAEEYLSGEVREKLEWLENSAAELKAAGKEIPDDYAKNIRALREVQPKKLEAKDIKVSLGATWVSKEYYAEFVRDLLDLQPGSWYHDHLDVKMVTKTIKDKLGEKEIEEWSINFASDRSMGSNELIRNVYGVSDVPAAHAFRLIQDSMNNRSTRIEIKDEPKKSMLATQEAQVRQRKIEGKFREWIFKDEKRRNELVAAYNKKFNSTVVRKYDGSHLTFPGMNMDIQLKDFQKDAVARVIYGGNTLLAHVVGAGKTFEMIAAAMESKRLGHCNKPMIVVPNHLVMQTANEFMRLYPGANIIVPMNSNELSRQKRRKFVARVATNNCDAVIVPHSFFNKMKMSAEYCKKFVAEEKLRLSREKRARGGRGASVKNIEIGIANLDEYIRKLEEGAKRDINIEFDKLGCDMLFVDEAHEYKNLRVNTNVRAKGLGNTEGSNRAWDMNMKVQFINEKTNYKGVVFATGTPVSNSLVELFTMQKYLRPDRLKHFDIDSFDKWSKTFASVESNMELDVTGAGFRTTDRLSKFFNVPELMKIVWEFADIKTADMLKLPTPEVSFENVITQPTKTQDKMIEGLINLCKYVRQHPREEEVIRMGGMLGVTNKGRKVALDQRYVNPDALDEKGTKLDVVTDNVARIYKEYERDRLTQVIFCDIATPKIKSSKRDSTLIIGDNDFSAYDDMKKKLIAKGVKAEEIVFIHEAEAKSDPAKAKQEIFNKMQAGKIRVLIGSTQRLGVGANFQRKLIGLHNVDCPWRPLDFTQRIGRIVRQGNENEHVFVYNYGTERTFDAYMYSVVAAKQKFAGQIMTGQIKDRECDDLGEERLDYGQMTACLTGDERILKQANLTKKVKELEEERNYFYQDKYEAEDKLNKVYPQKKILHENRIKEYDKIAKVAKAATAENYADIQQKVKILADEIAAAKDILSDNELKELREKRAELKKLENSTFGGMYFENKGVLSTDRANANKMLFEVIETLDKNAFGEDIEKIHVGKYRNIDLDIYYHFAFGQPMAALSVDGGTPLEVKISGVENADNFLRIDNALGSLAASIRIEESDLEQLEHNIKRCQNIVNSVFEHEEELEQLQEELIRLNQELDVTKNKSSIMAENTPDIDLSDIRIARTNNAEYVGAIVSIDGDNIIQHWEDSSGDHGFVKHDINTIKDGIEALQENSNVEIKYIKGNGTVTLVEKSEQEELERE